MSLTIVRTGPRQEAVYTDRQNRTVVTLEAETPSVLNEIEAAKLVETAGGPGNVLGIHGGSPPYPVDASTGEVFEILDKNGELLPPPAYTKYRKDFYVRPWRGI